MSDAPSLEALILRVMRLAPHFGSHGVKLVPGIGGYRVCIELSNGAGVFVQTNFCETLYEALAAADHQMMGMLASRREQKAKELADYDLAMRIVDE